MNKKDTRIEEIIKAIEIAQSKWEEKKKSKWEEEKKVGTMEQKRIDKMRVDTEKADDCIHTAIELLNGKESITNLEKALAKIGKTLTIENKYYTRNAYIDCVWNYPYNLLCTLIQSIRAERGLKE